MSTIFYSISKVSGLDANGGVAPVASSAVHASGTITSSGTSQQTSALSVPTGQEARSFVWDFVNGGSDPIYLVSNSNPTAVVNGVGMRHLLLAGASKPFHAEANGEKFAIINATVA